MKQLKNDPLSREFRTKHNNDLPEPPYASSEQLMAMSGDGPRSPLWIACGKLWKNFRRTLG